MGKKAATRGRLVLSVLLLAGCAESGPLKPVVEIRSREVPSVKIADVRSDRFLVFMGDRLVAVTTTATTPILSLPGDCRECAAFQALSDDASVLALEDPLGEVSVVTRGGRTRVLEATRPECPFPDPMAHGPMRARGL